MTDITGLVLTYNEAPNIARTLERLAFLRRIIVVDSNSSDNTADIARQFPNVSVVTRPFTTHAEQWSFGLEETGITSEWVLALDADYVLSDGVIAEIASLADDGPAVGVSASIIYCVDGRPLRGAAYPPVTVLYRRRAARYEQDGHTQRVRVDGPVGMLTSPIMHDDRKPLAHWLAAQARYMTLEAEKLRSGASPLGLPDRVRRWIVVAPPAMFIYCYFVRGGVLDGRAGLFYALQRMVSELILSLSLLQRRR